MAFTSAYGFYKWIGRFEAEASNLQRNTHINESSINTNHGMNSGYNWPWGNSYTSILLRGDAKAFLLNHSDYRSSLFNLYEDAYPGTKFDPALIDYHVVYPFGLIRKASMLF